MSAALRVLATQFRISVSSAMAYRADFLVEGFMAIAWTVQTLIPVIILFGVRDTVAGWDVSSALVVIGYFMLVRAVLEGVVSPSLVALVEQIRSGAFDYVLLKPVDAQLMVSCSSFEPWKIFDALGALAVIAYAFWRRGDAPGIGDVGLGALLLVAGVLAMYAVWICCAAASFWVVRLDNLTYLLGAVFDVARWPVQVFRGAWRLVFTFVVPVAIMTTYPAMALLGKLDAGTVAAVLGGTLGMLVVSRVIWRIAIRNYTSASS